MSNLPAAVLAREGHGQAKPEAAFSRADLPAGEARKRAAPCNVASDAQIGIPDLKLQSTFPGVQPCLQTGSVVPDRFQRRSKRECADVGGFAGDDRIGILVTQGLGPIVQQHSDIVMISNAHVFAP
ncbi:hypothetical protein EDE05_10771 [Neorhizobium sp. R1-B]|nr:hypothetical protein EDE09_107143 [Neorhizobium sp. S3-V5DH]TDX83408.1 hypothetical protein EDE05_10771 [Neorhizobium sp. R1-B]